MDRSEFKKYVQKAIDDATAEHSFPAGPVPTMTPDKLARLTAMLAAGRENVWYNGAAWEHMRRAVLKMDRYECQRCKARGRYHKAEIVHHVKHLKDRPDLALSIYDPDTGGRQLISVCKKCHELLHPEAQRQYRPKGKPVTAERWD